MQKSNPIWRPFTNMKASPEPLKVLRGQGIWLEMEDESRIMDLISSWWVNLHGHSHPEIADAIYEQAKTLEHVIFAGYTHEPAEKLTKLLLSELPENQSRIFFTDNGSTAVEVALKMSYQYWKNQGINNKTKFLAFEGAYHGDTFGAMSAGSRSVFTNTFEELFFEVDYLDYPAIKDNIDIETAENEVLNKLQKLVSDSDQYAALIIEPLVQGAGGMNMCRAEFLQKLEVILRSNNVLLIYDEVMTGFGRTGDWFAARASETSPDIICMSKGITGGFMPLAVTSTNDKVYEAFYDNDSFKTLYHGHSYTANPLGCAAAVASFHLTKKAEPIFRSFSNRYREFIESLNELSGLRNIRNTGTILALDIVTNKEDGYLNPIADSIKKETYQSGMLIRPLGNTVYLMPPYCITDDELNFAFEKLLTILKKVVA